MKTFSSCLRYARNYVTVFTLDMIEGLEIEKTSLACFAKSIAVLHKTPFINQDRSNEILINLVEGSSTYPMYY